LKLLIRRQSLVKTLYPSGKKHEAENGRCRKKDDHEDYNNFSSRHSGAGYFVSIIPPILANSKRDLLASKVAKKV
jgi:hypothetical protein